MSMGAVVVLGAVQAARPAHSFWEIDCYLEFTSDSFHPVLA